MCVDFNIQIQLYCQYFECIFFSIKQSGTRGNRTFLNQNNFYSAYGIQFRIHNCGIILCLLSHILLIKRDKNCVTVIQIVKKIYTAVLRTLKITKKCIRYTKQRILSYVKIHVVYACWKSWMILPLIYLVSCWCSHEWNRNRA